MIFSITSKYRVCLFISVSAILHLTARVTNNLLCNQGLFHEDLKMKNNYEYDCGPKEKFNSLVSYKFDVTYFFHFPTYSFHYIAVKKQR